MDEFFKSQKNGLRFIFFAHLFPSVWSSQCNNLPFVYAIYNFTFLICILWSLHSEKGQDPVLMSIGLDGASIIFDIIIIGMYYPKIYILFSSLNLFINLLFRPVSLLLLVRYLNERTGNFNSLLNQTNATPRPLYQNMDNIQNSSFPPNVNSSLTN